MDEGGHGYVQIDSSLGASLLRLADVHSFLNIKPLSATAVASHFIPYILPTTWPETAEVVWTAGRSGLTCHVLGAAFMRPASNMIVA